MRPRKLASLASSTVTCTGSSISKRGWERISILFRRSSVPAKTSSGEFHLPPKLVIEYLSMGTPQISALEQIKSAMAAVSELFNVEVIGKRNFAALDRIYTSNARILPPGAPIVSGREAIKKFWADLVESVHAK